jgi:hypothetical protein
MARYKILETTINEDVSTSILNKDTGIICPKCTGNKEYDQFLQDVKEQGLGIVEGPDITTESYVTLRLKEYPPLEEQLDKIYHSTLTAWKAEIKAIKDKYPKTITGGSTGGNAAPAWVQTEVDKLNS